MRRQRISEVRDAVGLAIWALTRSIVITVRGCVARAEAAEMCRSNCACAFTEGLAQDWYADADVYADRAYRLAQRKRLI